MLTGKVSEPNCGNAESFGLEASGGLSCQLAYRSEDLHRLPLYLGDIYDW